MSPLQVTWTLQTLKSQAMILHCHAAYTAKANRMRILHHSIVKIACPRSLTWLNMFKDRQAEQVLTEHPSSVQSQVPPFKTCTLSFAIRAFIKMLLLYSGLKETSLLSLGWKKHKGTWQVDWEVIKYLEKKNDPTPLSPL